MWVNSGLVKLDTIYPKASAPVRIGQMLAVDPPQVAKDQLSSYHTALDIVFEDDHLLVINKPPGLTVHPGSGTRGDTLLEAIVGLYESRGETFPYSLDNERPGVVHRLDRDTSGLIVWAKTELVCEALKEQFRLKTNLRQYASILWGKMVEPTIRVKSYIARHPTRRTIFVNHDDPDEGGKIAISDFNFVEPLGTDFSLVRVRLHTGRTHQIRVHAQKIGLSVLGDRSYGSPAVCWDRAPEGLRAAASRQMLHATHLGFHHPATGAWSLYKSPIPEDFVKIIDILGE